VVGTFFDSEAPHVLEQALNQRSRFFVLSFFEKKKKRTSDSCNSMISRRPR
jgi:hypothetical protein